MGPSLGDLDNGRIWFELLPCGQSSRSYDVHSAQFQVED